MKKFFVATIIFLFLSILAFPVFAQTSSENFRRGDTVILEKDEIVDGDFFAFGERVEISGTVNGDVYVAGGMVFVDGVVNGDLIAAGGTINISGKISQDVRIGAGQITITGSIGKNITFGGGNVEITDSASIAGSILAGAGNVVIAASVGGDIRIGSGSLTLSNQVKGNVVAGVEDLRLRSKAKIEGNLFYWSKKDASIDSSAKIVGGLSRFTPDNTINLSATKLSSNFNGFFFVLKIVSIFYTLVIGLLLIKFLPTFSQNAADRIKNKPWPTLGWGVLVFFGIPLLIIGLLISVIGIPFALVATPAYLIVLYVVRIFVFLFTGQFVAEKLNLKINKYLVFILGGTIYYLIQLIPLIGGFVIFLVLLLGLGAVIAAKKDFYISARDKNIL